MSSYGEDPKEMTLKARAAAERALELDPTLARPHATLGIVNSNNRDFHGVRPSS
jgi:hypothetical protein